MRTAKLPWISVNTELPPERAKVLTRLLHRGEPYYEFGRYVMGGWNVCGFMSYMVTHWVPLTEPEQENE